MHIGFAGNAETEPEERRAGWRMHIDFAIDMEVWTETTTASRFGWGV
jgi:hypothetical protein